MSLNNVTVTWTAQDLSATALGGSVSFVPNTFLTDPTDGPVIGQAQKTYHFLSGSTGTASVIATDNLNIVQSGWLYVITVSLTGCPNYTFNAFINFASGATQKLSSLVPVVTPPAVISSLPLPTGTPSAGQVPVATGAGEASVWTTLAGPQPVSRRPAWRPSVYSQIFQTGHGWTAGGAGTGSSNMNDTSTFIRGTQCTSATTTGTAVQSNISNTALTLPSQAGKLVRLVFKVDNVTNLDHINFYLGTSNFTNFFQWTPHTHSNVAGQQNYIQSGEWVTIDIQWADLVTASGAFSINAHGVPSVQSGFTCMRFAVYDNGSGPVTYHLQAVEIAADTSNTFPQGVVSISFDDSYQNQFTYARPAMDTLGYRGTLFTIQDVLGTGSYLTLAQLQQLASISGWDVQGHAYTGAAHTAGYNTLTALQVSNEMRSLRTWMLSNGFAGDVFAYPHGWFGNTSDGVPVEQIAMQYWAAARSIINDTAEVGPGPPMPYRIKSVTGINDGISLGGTTVANLVAAGGPLDRCVSNADWLILTFHQIITGTPTDSTMCSQAGFQTVMSAIQSYGIPVLPVADVLRNYS